MGKILIFLNNLHVQVKVKGLQNQSYKTTIIVINLGSDLVHLQVIKKSISMGYIENDYILCWLRIHAHVCYYQLCKCVHMHCRNKSQNKMATQIHSSLSPQLHTYIDYTLKQRSLHYWACFSITPIPIFLVPFSDCKCRVLQA